jgi:hypothetical protein
MSEPVDDRCEQQINAGAWVLGALDGDDAGGFAGHLEHCEFCQVEVARLMMVSDAMPLASEQIVPPPALGDRIMAVVASEAQLLRAAGPDADRVPARPRRDGRRWLLGLRRRRA